MINKLLDELYWNELEGRIKSLSKIQVKELEDIINDVKLKKEPFDYILFALLPSIPSKRKEKMTKKREECFNFIISHLEEINLNIDPRSPQTQNFELIYTDWEFEAKKEIEDRSFHYDTWIR